MKASTSSATKIVARRPPIDDQEVEWAEACLRRHTAAIYEMWKGITAEVVDADVLCLVGDKDDESFIGFYDRARLAREFSLEDLFPQMMTPAWRSFPRTPPGTSIWVIVRTKTGGRVCLRMTMTSLVKGGSA